jgi:hypothetical protein
LAWRVTPDEVRDILDANEDIRIEPFIGTANVLTDRVSAQDTNSLLNSDTLTQIELYLAAHFYTNRDPLLASEKTERASGKYQGEWGKGLDSSSYGQTALLLDDTGYLATLGKKVAVGVDWIGKPTDDQETAWDRGWDRSLQ